MTKFSKSVKTVFKMPKVVVPAGRQYSVMHTIQISFTNTRCYFEGSDCTSVISG